MSTEWTMIEGEVGVQWNRTLKRRTTGDDFDLTGATVTLLVDSQTARSMTIVDAATGAVRYTTVSGDNTSGTGMLPKEGRGKDGKYWGVIKVASGSNTYYTLEPIPIRVIPQVRTEA